MKLTVLILEDEPEVRAAIERDLLDFAPTVRIEPAEDADDAWDVVREVLADGDALALALCDHRLPGTTGVDFLIQLAKEPRAGNARKVLITGQADLADTVRAVNQAGLDHYIAKPWTVEELRATVKAQLTNYVEATGLDPVPHMAVLDKAKAMGLLRSAGRAD